MTGRATVATGRHRPVLDASTLRRCEVIAADPRVPVHTAVVAPGGYGKSVVLAEIRAAYRRSGMLVVDSAEAIGDLAGREPAALVVDDAHRLGEAQLRALRLLADEGQVGITVAYRPWPRPAAMAELADALGRSGPPLMPAPFDLDQVEAFVASRTAADPHPALVEYVHAQTGGVPRFVDRLVTALESHGTAHAGPPKDLPRAAILAFRHDVETLGDDVLRFLLAVEAGAGLHIELLGGLLGRDSAAVGEVMAAARATGLLGHDGVLLPITRRAIAALVPMDRRIGVRQRLAELQLDGGGPVLALARGLLGTGFVGVNAAAVFHTAALEATQAQPELAARLFEATAAAGSPVSAMGTDWADAAARSGDLDTALRLADQVLGSVDSADRATAACVAAAALAHRGELTRSTELYRWAGSPSAVAFAATGLLATGRLAEARELAAPATDGPPTMLTGAASLVARGVSQSVDGSSRDALTTLVRAATLLEPAGGSVLLPDSPAAVAAIVALHCGELGMAESVLDRAIAFGVGGPLLAARHRLLRAWTHLVHGDLTAAYELLAAACSGRRLEPRDALFAVALEVGLARRRSDLPALGQAWGRAREAMVRQPVDLFTLLPLGELAMAAARLGEHARLEPHLAEARSLLAGLGDPPLWATPLHWSELHAWLIAEQPDEAERHAAALAAIAGSGRYQAVLAGAAHCWLAVVAGRIDPERVEAAARGLHGAGLRWDGARLAGQAAIRTSDRRAMVQLLDTARLLQGRSTTRPAVASPVAPPASPVAAPPAAPATGDADSVGGSALSARELEVAELVLAGLTYKQVGGRLFISAKTVEHHVARMRRKLGCESRSELLAELRRLVAARGSAVGG